MNSTLQLKKTRELGEVLGDSFTFLKENLKYIYKPILIIGVIWAGLYSFLLTIGLISLSSKSFITDGRIGEYLGSQSLIIILSAIGSLSIQIILLNLIKFKAENPEGEPATRDLFIDFSNQFFRLFLYSIPVFFYLILFLLLLVIPGIWYSVFFVYFIPVVFFEKGSVSTLLTRTRGLVKGHWWNSFLAYFVPYLLIAIILSPFSFFTAYYLMGHVMDSHISVGYGVFYFFFLLLNIFLQLWPSSCIVLQYLNLVDRKDHAELARNLDTLGTNIENPSVTGPEEF